MKIEWIASTVRTNVLNQAEIWGLKGKQVLDAIVLTKNTIKEELQNELNQGQYQPVLDFLRNHGVKIGQDILFDKIVMRVVGRLMLRLGLPGGLALTVATLLVPILLKKISKKALNSGKIQDLFTNIACKDYWQTQPVFKNLIKNKFSRPEAT